MGLVEAVGHSYTSARRSETNVGVDLCDLGSNMAGREEINRMGTGTEHASDSPENVRWLDQTS